MYGSSLYLNQVDGVFSLPYINAYFSVQFTIITFAMIDHVVRQYNLLQGNLLFEQIWSVVVIFIMS